MPNSLTGETWLDDVRRTGRGSRGVNSNPGPSDLLPARLEDDRDDPEDEEAAGLRQVELLERPTERGD